jgi:hypothetical protein
MKSLLCVMMLVSALAVAACTTNQAQQPYGSPDHNNDLPSWEQ